MYVYQIIPEQEKKYIYSFLLLRNSPMRVLTRFSIKSLNNSGIVFVPRLSRLHSISGLLICVTAMKWVTCDRRNGVAETTYCHVR